MAPLTPKTLFARLAGLGRRHPSPSPDDAPAAVAGAGPDDGQSAASAPAEPVAAPESRVPAGVACPSCAALLDPPPARNRRCPSCRQPIVVRRTGGRTVYLTESAVAVFESERRRHLDEAAWQAARSGWLKLARQVGAPDERIARIAARPVTADAVAQARALCETSAARAIRTAAKAKRWEAAARLGRDLAAERHRADGSPSPPDAATVALHRDAMTALLRSLRVTGKHAELVGGGCCAACRADEGRVLAIDAELRDPRLPHAGCPRGLCGCEWWLAASPKRARGARRRAQR